MSRIVELSSGHVFDADSVRAITPVRSVLVPLQGDPSRMVHGGIGFDVVGVGYVVTIHWPQPPHEGNAAWHDWVAKYEQSVKASHDDAVLLLLRGKA